MQQRFFSLQDTYFRVSAFSYDVLESGSRLASRSVRYRQVSWRCFSLSSAMSRFSLADSASRTSTYPRLRLQNQIFTVVSLLLRQIPIKDCPSVRSILTSSQSVNNRAFLPRSLLQTQLFDIRCLQESFRVVI